MQGLIDVRNQLDRYAAPDTVEWHFASITNRWTKRALTVAGFGYLSAEKTRARQHWNPVFSFAAIGAEDKAKPLSDEEKGHDAISSVTPDQNNASSNSRFPSKVTTVHGLNRPFFHIDVAAAVESAIAGVDAKLAHTSSGSSAEEVGSAELKS